MAHLFIRNRTAGNHMDLFRPYMEPDYDKLLQYNGAFLRSIPETERSRYRCNIALANTAHAFPYVPVSFHTEDMCLDVAERCPVYFPIMTVQTPAVIRAALKIPHNYHFIRTPNEEYLDLAIRNGGSELIRNSTRRNDIDYLLSLIDDNPRILEHLTDQPDELVKRAMYRDVSLYKIVRDKDKYLDLFLTCLEKQFGVPVLHAGPEMIWPMELQGYSRLACNAPSGPPSSPTGKSSTGGSVPVSPGPAEEQNIGEAELCSGISCWSYPSTAPSSFILVNRCAHDLEQTT